MSGGDAGLLLNPFLPDTVEMTFLGYELWRQDWFNAKTYSETIATRTFDGGLRNWQLAAVEDKESGIQVLLSKLDAADAPDSLVGIWPLGTNQRRDWWRNLNFWRVKMGGGWYRKGYFDGGTIVGQLAQARAQEAWGVNIYGRGVSLVIGGHSMAAATGGCFAAQLSHFQPAAAKRVQGLVLLSGPRYCSAGASRRLEEHFPAGKGQRLRHGFDAVPTLVPPVGLRHALDFRAIGSDGVVRGVYPFWRELRSAIRRDGIQFVADHGTECWQEWLSQEMARRGLR